MCVISLRQEGDEDGLEATKLGGMETDEEEGTSTMTLSLPGKGITKVTINTAKILEQAQTARAIYEHAAALGSAFGPYAEVRPSHVSYSTQGKLSTQRAPFYLGYIEDPSTSCGLSVFI